jgi:hypothetical protein
MNREPKLEIKAEDTASESLKRYQQELLPLSILSERITLGEGESVGVLDLEKIYPKLLIWWPLIPWEEEKREELILPERLTNPYYGSEELDRNLKEMAKKAPGIKKIWEMTKDSPSLTQILLEEREEEND